MRNPPRPKTSTPPGIGDWLRLLADPLEAPRPGDWLAEHRQMGQTIRQSFARNLMYRVRVTIRLVGTYLRKADASAHDAHHDNSHDS